MQEQKFKNRKTDQLCEKLRSLLNENGYGFSDEDRALLEKILRELEELSTNEIDGNSRSSLVDYLLIALRFLKFFGIDDVDQML